MGATTIIIGGGIAGISAGIYSRLNAYDTEILEMHSGPGGQCTSWVRKGYTFDYCIHWLVGSSSGPFNSIWKETGALDGSVNVIDPETYGTIRTEDGDLVVYTDINRWEEYLIQQSPGDRVPVKKLSRDLRRVATLKMGDKVFGKGSVLDKMRFFMTNLPVVKVFGLHGRESVREYFDKLGFEEGVLKRKFDSFAGIMEGFSAVAFLLTLSWFATKNAGYPEGGSMPLINRMMGRYHSLGGRFSGGARVEKILTEGKRAVGVRLSDGTEKFADNIIGAADLHTMIYGMLEGKFITPEIEKAFASWPTFNPIVQVSFGIDRGIECGDHTLVVVRKGERIGNTDLNSGYKITNYNRDRVITREGNCVMKLSFDSPLEMWERMDPGEYISEKERIRTDAISILESLYPDVKDHIEVVDVATPLTDIRYTGVWKGAYEGFLPSVNNIGRSMQQTIGGLENFFLAGQWLYPGGGLPPSAQSGKTAVQLLCRKDKKIFKTG
ncbi:MAG: NAD(P)/FAD-dependent oxidoreductase [Bacteroidetes bacterium]|nr:NAD(P)/FAD-dependent oxidoreductase [Bacteroidota bacterium]